MNAVTFLAAAPTRAAAPALTLEERFTLAQLAMDERLTQASAAISIRTAPIEIPVVDLADVVPLTPTLAPAPAGGSPVADHLRRAREHMAAVGWTPGRRRDEAGAVCALGGLYATAGGGSVADAAAVLLDAIHQEFPNALTVPSWSDQQGGAGPVLRMLDRAARLADHQET